MDQINKCFVCLEIIDDDEDFVTASANNFHMDCFVCSYCFSTLENQVYYEFDSHVFCEEHYLKIYSPKCGKCEEGIIGEMRTVKGFSFHLTCFTCQTCNVELDNLSCVCSDDGVIKCAECHKKSDKFVGDCGTCNEPLLNDDYLLYKGSYVHPYHHQCFSCHLLLKKGAIIYNDTFYCEKCYDFKIAKICCVCKTAIHGVSVLVDDRYYHPNHFICSVCNMTLKAEAFYSIKNYIFCKPHFNQYFVTPCFVCGEGDADQNTQLFGKFHCPKHRMCYHCFRLVEDKSNMVAIDNKPVCESCFKEMPAKIKKSMRKIFVNSQPYEQEGN